jgi:peptide/nickel transport system permease protein
MSKSGALQRRWRMGRVLAPIVLLCVAVTVCILFSSDPPGRLDLSMTWAPPSPGHPFGRGEAGVDLLMLVAHATGRALVLAFAVAMFGFLLGTPLGGAAGFARGRWEQAILRMCDLVQAFPTFLLALAVLSSVRVPSRWHIGVVFCLTVWAPFARIAAVQARVLSAAHFVEAARALGLGPVRVVRAHILPNLLGPVAVQLGTSAAGVVIGESALGFVGLGPPDGVSLGALLEQGTLSMLRAPHVLAVGALTVACVSGALQLGSEALRRWTEVP